MRLNGDTFLSFEIHIIEGLGDQFAAVNGTCHLKQAVCQSTFAVIDVGYDTEIADIFHLLLLRLKNGARKYGFCRQIRHIIGFGCSKIKHITGV